MSAIGTTLLQSPGSNEGKARYETLGNNQRNYRGFIIRSQFTILFSHQIVLSVG